MTPTDNNVQEALQRLDSTEMDESLYEDDLDHEGHWFGNLGRGLSNVRAED